MKSFNLRIVEENNYCFISLMYVSSFWLKGNSLLHKEDTLSI